MLFSMRPKFPRLPIADTNCLFLTSQAPVSVWCVLLRPKRDGGRARIVRRIEEEDILERRRPAKAGLILTLGEAAETIG